MRIIKVETSIEGCFNNDQEARRYLHELGVGREMYVLKNGTTEARVKTEDGNIVYRLED